MIGVLQIWRPTRRGGSPHGVCLRGRFRLRLWSLSAAFAVARPRRLAGTSRCCSAALAAIAAVAFFAEVRLKLATAAYFDASIVVALLALAIAGPLPALLIWLIPDLIARFVFRTYPIWLSRPIRHHGDQLRAGAAGRRGRAQLAAAPSAAAAAPALFTAGAAMWAVNFAVARLIVRTALPGLPGPRAVRSEFFALAPAVMAMLALDGRRLAAARAARRIRAARARRRDSAAAARISLSRPPPLGRRLTPDAGDRCLRRGDRRSARRSRRLERRLLVDAARLLEGWERRPPPPALPSRLHPLAGVVAVGVDERWDGGGRPFGIPASRTMLASRVLAVARAWSALDRRRNAGAEPDRGDARAQPSRRAPSSTPRWSRRPARSSPRSRVSSATRTSSRACIGCRCPAACARAPLAPPSPTRLAEPAVISTTRKLAIALGARPIAYATALVVKRRRRPPAAGSVRRATPPADGRRPRARLSRWADLGRDRARRCSRPALAPVVARLRRQRPRRRHRDARRRRRPPRACRPGDASRLPGAPPSPARRWRSRPTPRLEPGRLAANGPVAGAVAPHQHHGDHSLGAVGIGDRVAARALRRALPGRPHELKRAAVDRHRRRSPSGRLRTRIRLSGAPSAGRRIETPIPDPLVLGVAGAFGPSARVGPRRGRGSVASPGLPTPPEAGAASPAKTDPAPLWRARSRSRSAAAYSLRHRHGLLHASALVASGVS